MRFVLAILFLVVSVGSFAQIDTLKFWNGEYWVVRNDSVVYPPNLYMTGRAAELYMTERAAEFVGGKSALDQFIGANLTVPSEMRHQKVNGRVEAIFYIDKAGMAKKIIVQGDTTLGRGKEVKRLIEAMPRWKPAILNDRPVEMRMILPIAFEVEGAKRKR
jgi:hypothetical protein